MLRFPYFQILFIALIASGCSSSLPDLQSPTFASDAGAAALKQYDSDGDGMLGAAELQKASALKDAAARIDANGDGRLTAEEIDRRVQALRESDVAIMPVNVTIRLDQRPLADADVTFIPEKFLGSSAKVAKGKTNEKGGVFLRVSDDPYEQGMSPGFYRIEISRKNGDKETIPAKYNESSELGVEVARDVPGSRDFVLNLSSR